MYSEDFSNNSLVFDDKEIKNAIFEKFGNHCCIAVVGVKCNHYICNKLEFNDKLLYEYSVYDTQILVTHLSSWDK